MPTTSNGGQPSASLAMRRPRPAAAGAWPRRQVRPRALDEAPAAPGPGPGRSPRDWRWTVRGSSRMHLKWFKGRAVLDVMRRVREELGPEAVILRSKFVHPWGLLRLFGGSRVEILAAVDRPEAPATQAMLQVPPEASPSLDSLRSELAALRSLFLRSAGGGLVPAILGPLYEHLLAGGMDPALAMRILGSVPAHQLEQEAAKMATYRAVEEQMASLIAVSTCAAVSGQLRLAFVGPSGMGKTTTLAKMAARVRITGGSIAIVN